MTITYPLALPPAPGIRRIRWAAAHAVATRRSPYSLKRRAHRFPGQMWAGSVVLPPMQRAEAEQWVALQLALDGPFGTFLMRDPDAQLARGPVGVIGAHRNDVANNTMQGANPATDTLPTGWSFLGDGFASLAVDAVGVEGGIEFIEVTITGTNTSGGARFPILAATGNQVIAASQGQTWTHSAYLSQPGAPLSHQLRIDVSERNSSGTFIDASNNGPETLTGSLVRKAHTRTLAQAATAYMQGRVTFNIPDTETLNATFRMGLPQKEMVAAATTPIRTFGTARARPAGPFVEGGGQTGLIVKTGGWAPLTTPLLVGDLVQLGSGLFTRSHKTLTAQQADVAGEIDLDIWPRLRETPIDAAPIVTTACAFAAHLAAGTTEWEVDEMVHWGLAFDFAEAI